MGKAGRARKHDERMKKKRALKAARRAQYAALAGTSRRNKGRSKKSSGVSPLRGAHATSDCGNVGCGRCHPALNPSGGLPGVHLGLNTQRLRKQKRQVEVAA